MGCKGCCTSKACMIASMVVGGVLVVLGGCMMFIFDEIYVSVLKKQTSVVPGTLMYNLNWIDVETPVYRSFYLFNVTNKEQFLAQKPGNYVKPVLQEIGPYTYREYLSKENVVYLDYNRTHPEEAYFKQTATFYFDRERSVGSEEDVITTLNFLIPLVPALLEYLLEPGPVLNAAYITFNQLVETTNSELLFTMTVGEYLFGFEDPLLTALLDLLVPDRDSDKFGVFLLTNVSQGWPDYQVYTGRGQSDLTNVITRYKNMSELPYWFGESCNEIKGTDGTFTPPFMQQEDPTFIYIDEMCRSIYTEYVEDETVLNIKGWKFTVPPETFYSPINNEENTCYCKDLSHELCQHDGALLVASCLFNVPLVVSFPHFLYEDGFYSSKLIGMKPDKKKHEIEIVYEPTTGLVIRTESKMQLGMYVAPHDEITILQQISETFVFPMLWLNENAILQEEDAEWVYVLLYQVDDLVLIIQILVIIIGSLLFIAYAAYGIRLHHRKNKEINMLETQSQKKCSKLSMRYSSNDGEVFAEKESRKTNATYDRNERYISTSSTTYLVE